MSHFNPAFQNQIIASLPTADYQRLEPHLEFVSLSLGQVLYEPREPITHIYFPLKALVSLIRPVNHSSSKFGLVGNEGLVGFPALLGGESTISRAVVQLADGALKIDAKILKSEFDRGGMLQKQILLYLQLFITQTAQNAACRVHHSIEARLARWFL
ncbi:MAG: Crp/Fnr family transcriptional regulator [Microcoleaceae cyanobacterium]